MNTTTNRTLIFSAAVAVMALEGCKTPSQGDAGAEAVVYAQTLGQLRTVIGEVTRQLHGKNALIARERAGKVITGAKAIELLERAKFFDRSKDLKEVIAAKKWLSKRGARAIAIEGADTPLLYLPYPDQAERKDCIGLMIDLSLFDRADEEGCICYSGKQPGVGCYCGGYSAYCPCTTDCAAPCPVNRPMDPALLEECASVGGCRPELFTDPKPFRQLEAGMFL